LDTPGDDGVSKRAKLKQVVKTSNGMIIPHELEEELQPDPEEQVIFDMFFEMYSTEKNFYVVLDAYCRVWELALAGDDISMLQLLWRETDHWFSERQKKKSKKTGKPSSSPSRPHKPSKTGRR